MHLVLIGCEYAGKSTLARQISEWMIEDMGLPSVRWHAHFVLPQLDRHIVVPDRGAETPMNREEVEELLHLSPAIKEQLLRYMIWRHLHDDMFRESDDYLAIDFYYGEAVYAPLYYGYGGPDDSFSDRRRRAREWESELLLQAPDTVLVLLRASVDTVRRRMSQNPHPGSILRTDDVPTVLRRFEEEYADSQIERRFALDTTDSSADETLVDFLWQMRQHLSEMDSLRIAFNFPRG